MTTNRIIKFYNDSIAEPISVPFSLCQSCAHLVNFVNDCFGGSNETEIMFLFDDVDEKTIKKVVEWLQADAEHKIHFDAKEIVDLSKFTTWETTFFNALSIDELINFLNAANKIECTKMLHTAERYLASKIVDKSPEEIAHTLGLEPLTEKELQELEEFSKNEDWGTDESATLVSN